MSQKHYLKVYWHHAFEDEPSVCFYEVTDGWAKRVIEVFDSGETRWADGKDELGGARFPDQPIGNGPDPNEQEFHVLKISLEQFQRLWALVINKA